MLAELRFVSLRQHHGEQVVRLRAVRGEANRVTRMGLCLHETPRVEKPEAELDC